MPYTKEQRKAKRAEGKCLYCLAKPSEDGMSTCRRCRSKLSKHSRAHQVRQRVAGRCVGCAADYIGAGVCAGCRTRRQARYHAKVKAGICTVGGCMAAATGAQICEEHWFRMISTTHKLGGKRAVPMLRHIWDRQGGICALTGDPLVVGGGASLDHIRATSRGGDSSESNLRWVTLIANRMKLDMSDDEFFEACRKVVNRTASQVAVVRQLREVKAGS